MSFSNTGLIVCVCAVVVGIGGTVAALVGGEHGG